MMGLPGKKGDPGVSAPGRPGRHTAYYEFEEMKTL